MSLVAIGLNHRTVPLELLERMTVSDAALPKALHDLVGREHVREAVVLSTCNRTEVYTAVEKFHGAYHDIREWFSELAFLPPEDFTDHLYVHYDADVAAHLFRVTSGLDSAVLGENEILGQVKRAWERARTEAVVGSSLNLLFRHALEVGKRTRTETAISRGITSVSQAAVALAADRIGGLDQRQAVVLGAGEVAEGVLAALGDADLAGLQIANRTWDRAETLARPLGATPVRLADLHDALVDADVCFTSTGAPGLMLEADEVDAILGRRNGRPLLFIDAAVPRDIDPTVAHLPGVTLLDMDDIRTFVDAGLGERRRAALDAQLVLDSELERFVSVSSAREVAPLVSGLRDRAEQIRQAELQRLAGRLGDLDDRQRDAVEALTRGIVAKLLHDPTVELKDAAGTPKGERLAEALRDLYDL